MKSDESSKSFPTYQASKARIRYVGEDLEILLPFILPIKNATKEQSYDRFFGFSHAKKQFFSKTLKISARQTHFFQKMTKIFYLLVDFFNKFY